MPLEHDASAAPQHACGSGRSVALFRARGAPWRAAAGRLLLLCQQHPQLHNHPHMQQERLRSGCCPLANPVHVLAQSHRLPSSCHHGIGLCVLYP